MGVAVLAGNELEFFGVKTITRRSSPSTILAQARQIIRKFIKLHTPEVLAIERPFLGYGNRSSLLVVLAREIRQLARKQGLQVVEISPKTVKKVVAGSGSITKREVARIVCSRFSELSRYLDPSQSLTKQKYWQNLFDAVAIALSAAALNR
ncbi:crossover junction endodeoxyribonuclease RuvC [Acidobacteria bacterium AH-259-A15]|nr:crossover junction endodeoxyribonuclease RuvC [Acidobacteria bacterium AH-259-A15]